MVYQLPLHLAFMFASKRFRWPYNDSVVRLVNASERDKSQSGRKMASGFTYMYAGLVAIFVLLFLNLAVARICEVRRKSRLQGAPQVCAVPKAACDHASLPWSSCHTCQLDYRCVLKQRPDQRRTWSTRFRHGWSPSRIDKSKCTTQYV